MNTRNRILLELGTEEIPSVYLLDIEEKLGRLARSVLEENRIEAGDIRVYYTPRRLCLCVADVADKQSELTEEIKGPPRAIAFDGEGNPLKPGLAFAQKCGVKISQIKFREVKGKESLFAVRKHKGKAVKTLLPEVFCAIIEGLRFPKTMRWNAHTIHFTRPLRWIAAKWNAQTVRFVYGPVKSADTTCGHRFMDNPRRAKIKTADPEEYKKLLRSLHVIADQKERETVIRDGIEKIYAAEKLDFDLDLCLDHANLALTVALTEWPVPLKGAFSEDFLRLPKDVPVTVMKKHQRYFAVEDGNGALKPMFITVSNIASHNPQTIVRGNERVLRARLADAVFFLETDAKKTLSQRTRELGQVIFQKQLGSYLDKVNRVKSLLALITEAGTGILEPAARPDEQDSLMLAADLYKCDLMTEMVKELPELQGIMGSHYAAMENISETVCRAIENQYFPRDAEDNAHMGFDLVSSLLAIADKVDTIAGCFSLGLIPSGSQDPYGLRRQANGAVKLALALNRPAAAAHGGLYELDLLPVLEGAFEAFRKPETEDERFEKRKDALLGFFRERINAVLTGRDFTAIAEEVFAKLKRPLPADDEMLRELTAAVSQTDGFNLCGLKSRIIDLLIMLDSDRDSFMRACKIMERTGNIIKNAGASTGAVDMEIMKEPAERELAEAFAKTEGQVRGLLSEKNYLQGLKLYADTLSAPVTAFFDSVLVNCPEENLRLNRQTLMKNIFDLPCAYIGNLSALAAKGAS